MEVLTTIENFEEGGGRYRVINSPRSLEACLRSGLDPAELYPKSKNFFTNSTKDLSKEMLEIKIDSYNKKRNGSLIILIVVLLMICVVSFIIINIIIFGVVIFLIFVISVFMTLI